MFSNEIELCFKKIISSLTVFKKPIDNILKRIDGGASLTIEELAILINAKKTHYNEILQAAKKLTRRMHGSGIGLIAPLYIDNNCDNTCSYCGMGKFNKGLVRKKIESLDAFVKEALVLRDLGYKTVEIVAGGTFIDPDQVVLYLNELKKYGIINRVFFFDTLPPDSYKKIVKGDPEVTMIHWQETYLKDEYKKYHPVDTPKGDYDIRLDAIETAIQHHLKKYGIGVLFGLSDPAKDTLMCISHGRYLEEKHRLSPKIVGLVRLQLTSCAEVIKMPYYVGDKDHLFYASILRIAFPKSEMVVTTREKSSHIEKILIHTATFTNFTCTTVPGGYHNQIREGLQIDGQFDHDSPSLKTVEKMVDSIGLTINSSRKL